MKRSTKDSWLSGKGDLVEAVVEDVPVKGESVRVRALSARFSAKVQSQMKMHTEGREQVARIDVDAMEALQFANGVIEPEFSLAEAKQLQEMYGPAFRKVVSKIDELSGVDKEAVAEAEARFPAGGNGAESGGGGELGAAVPDAGREKPEPAV